MPRKFLINLGDASPMQHGGFFVFRDGDREYVEALQEPDDDAMKAAGWDEDNDKLRWEVVTIEIPRMQLVFPDETGDTEEIRRRTYLDIELRDKHGNLADASFHDALEGTASTCGQWIMRYLHEICSDDPALRARVYQDIFDCYSSVLDTDRQELTRAEVKRRYRHYKGCL